MTGVNLVEIRKTPEPDVDPQGAILRVEACGICGTDARTFFNGDPKAPAPWILGHEPVGVIEELGPGAHLPPGVKKGDRVFLGSILTCGQCRWCTEGFQNLCDQHLLYGYDPYPGAYADYAPVPAIAMKNVIALPPDLPSDLATVADPFACALNGVEVLEKAAQFWPEVIVLDVGMPKLDGFETARLLRQQPWGRDAVLIAITGWGNEKDKRQSAEAGFNIHLVKPVDAMTILKHLEKLDQSKTKRQSG